MYHTVPRALSWAQAAREAAKRGTMLLLEAKLSLKSSRQVTRSMEGQDRMQRSDSKSLGPEERQEKVSRSQCTSQCSGALMVWFKFIFIYANAQREFCFDRSLCAVWYLVTKLVSAFVACLHAAHRQQAWWGRQWSASPSRWQSHRWWTSIWVRLRGSLTRWTSLTTPDLKHTRHVATLIFDSLAYNLHA